MALNPELLNENQTCPAVGYQSASICVPVTVTPFAQTGMTTTKSVSYTHLTLPTIRLV